MERIKRAGLLILIAGLVMPLAVSCKGNNNKKELKREVGSAEIKKGDISSEVMLTASIEAKDYAAIYPRGPGKVVKRMVNDGEKVKKDQTIMLTMRDEVGYTFKPAPIVSTIDGFVGRVNVDVGASVDMATPVATVVNPEKMRVKVDLPETYLPGIDLGDNIPFNTDTLPDDKFSGVVTTLSKDIDIKSRTARLELIADNPDGKLVHGMFGKIVIPIETHEGALLIPIQAVSWEADKQFVFLIDNDKLKRTEIRTGLRNTKNVEVVEGLNEGDHVALGDLITFNDGELVTVKTAQ